MLSDARLAEIDEYFRTVKTEEILPKARAAIGQLRREVERLRAEVAEYKFCDKVAREGLPYPKPESVGARFRCVRVDGPQEKESTDAE